MLNMPIFFDQTIFFLRTDINVRNKENGHLVLEQSQYMSIAITDLTKVAILCTLNTMGLTSEQANILHYTFWCYAF